MSARREGPRRRGSLSRHRMTSSAKKTCFACRLELKPEAVRCPVCDGPLVTDRGMRSRGWLLVVLGASMAVGMTYVSALMWKHREDFTGGPPEAVFTAAVMLFCIVFGATAFLGGIHMLVHGRRHTGLVRFIGQLFFVFLGLGALAQLMALAGD